jgi:hypothetical protein
VCDEPGCDASQLLGPAYHPECVRITQNDGYEAQYPAELLRALQPLARAGAGRVQVRFPGIGSCQPGADAITQACKTIRIAYCKYLILNIFLM